MEKGKKKLSVTPPEGEALARYTVRVKPLDVFKRRILLKVLPLAAKSAFWSAVCFFVFKYLHSLLLSGANYLTEKVHSFFLATVTVLTDYKWVFFLPFIICLLVTLPKVVTAAIKARTEATTEATASLNEEYAFFEGGLIYSNGKDIVRVSWKKVRLVTTSFMGMMIHAGSLTDTMIIPCRYFCTEYESLKESMKKILKLRFWRFKKLGRDRAPMYENPREKIAIIAPEGEPIGELTVSLKLGDLGDINSLSLRQIEQKHNRGVFGVILLLLCTALCFIAAWMMKEPMFIPAGGIVLGFLLFYSVFLTVGGLIRGRTVLVNSGDYKKPVRYIFYPAGFLMIYEDGISHVMYEDLDLIFEDVEGLGFFFSKRQCLFIPSRYMKSRDGVRLSHFFKASLFNLDPRRGRRKYKIDDSSVFDILKKKTEKPQKT